MTTQGAGMTLCLAHPEGVRKHRVSYQQNHTTIARDADNYGVRRSMWRKLILSYNDINMAQTRDGSRFRKIFRSV